MQETWAGKIPWRRKRLPTSVFWPGEFHGLYSLWGHKESDIIERLSLFHEHLGTWNSKVPIPNEDFSKTHYTKIVKSQRQKLSQRRENFESSKRNKIHLIQGNFPEAIGRLLSRYLTVQERVGLGRDSFPGKQNLREIITPRPASPEILNGIP